MIVCHVGHRSKGVEPKGPGHSYIERGTEFNPIVAMPWIDID